jgi:hypothetical protein
VTADAEDAADPAQTTGARGPFCPDEEEYGGTDTAESLRASNARLTASVLDNAMRKRPWGRGDQTMGARPIVVC